MRRFRKRRGYGVHSPFAFRFITEVIYETTPYYAYETLDTLLAPRQRFRVRKDAHLLLRLANYCQPRTIAMSEKAPLPLAYLHAGCRRSEIVTIGHCAQAELCYLSHPDDRAIACMDKGCILVLDNLHKHLPWFKRLPATLFFDLHDMGIAFFGVPYHKHYYIVNFE